jgi:hypothetical protein
MHRYGPAPLPMSLPGRELGVVGRTDVLQQVTICPSSRAHTLRPTAAKGSVEDVLLAVRLHFAADMHAFCTQLVVLLWCAECGHRRFGMPAQEPPPETFLMQFGLRVAQLLCPSVAVPQVFAAVRQALSEANAVRPEGPRLEQARKLELVFVHDCRYGLQYALIGLGIPDRSSQAARQCPAGQQHLPARQVPRFRCVSRTLFGSLCGSNTMTPLRARALLRTSARTLGRFGAPSEGVIGMG